MGEAFGRQIGQVCRMAGLRRKTQTGEKMEKERGYRQREKNRGTRGNQVGLAGGEATCRQGAEGGSKREKDPKTHSP